MRNRLDALACAAPIPAVPFCVLAEDVESSKDHPAVKRYPGSSIAVFEERTWT